MSDDEREFDAAYFRRHLLSNLVTDTIFITNWYHEFGEVCDEAFKATNKHTLEGRRQRESANASMALAIGVFGICRRLDHFLLMWYVKNFSEEDSDGDSGGDDDLPDEPEGSPKMPMALDNPFTDDNPDECDIRHDVVKDGLASDAKDFIREALFNRRKHS